jgi:hypothetical protein
MQMIAMEYHSQTQNHALLDNVYLLTFVHAKALDMQVLNAKMEDSHSSMNAGIFC